MLILGTLLLVAATSNPGPPPRGGPAPTDDAAPVEGIVASVDSGRLGQCSPIQVLSARERPRREPAFSASRSLDLGLRTLVRTHRRTPSTVEFRVLAPGGALYQSLLRSADPPEALPPGSTRDVRATLLVAGTAITANGLYGRWTVEAVVDGRPCGRPAAFLLSP
ncbi:MAG TPA: hypothetical protein VGB87_11120 [Vicinamibacteria bacterium]